MIEVRVGVSGACGRMGGSIIRKVLDQEDMEVVCAIEASSNSRIGEDIGEVLNLGKIGIGITSAEDLDKTLKETRPDVLVDFTSADTAVDTIKIAAKNGVNMVVGTTGFSDVQKEEISGAIELGGISAVISPNMATGVNVFFKIAGETARILRDYDIEIIETHHKHKKDAPSGTAVRVGEIIAEALGRDLDKDGVFGRKKGIIGERSKEEIGFHAIRAGDIVGEHTVLFGGDGERVEITHRAHSRDAFVNGTIKAIRFVNQNKARGKIYTTWDVLGIE
ncbi:MAG: 4-hydroxy-tetrahydrodipicolinate reductase [Candidatus Hydrothermarchaeales archaeon]